MLRPQRLVHVQRHVASSHEYSAARADLDLRERDLVRALAADVLVGQRGAAEVAKGEALQAVRLVRLEHVALEHRVVARSRAPRCRALAKTWLSYLTFWPTLAAAAFSSQGRSRASTVVERQLVGRAGVAVARAGCSTPRPARPPARGRSGARGSGRANRSRCRARPVGAPRRGAIQASSASSVVTVS